jgi:hypothetical protein
MNDASFRFRFENASSRDETKLEFRFQSLRDAVPPADVERHLDAVRALREALAHWVRPGRPAPSTGLTLADKAALFGIVGILGGVWLVHGVRRARKAVRRRRFVASARLPEGEAASSAFQVRDEEEMHRKLQSLRCVCGARAGTSQMERQSLMYDARPMTVVTRRCQWCGHEQSVYFGFQGKTA